MLVDLVQPHCPSTIPSNEIGPEPEQKIPSPQRLVMPPGAGRQQAYHPRHRRLDYDLVYYEALLCFCGTFVAFFSIKPEAEAASVFVAYIRAPLLSLFWYLMCGIFPSWTTGKQPF
ncbi:hypothetical protein BKA80DRAFT_270913 [Phyllosticta citrichinensis]